MALPKFFGGSIIVFLLVITLPLRVLHRLRPVMPRVKKTKVYARIVMTPQNVKVFHNALEQNIEKFEERFGKIKIMGQEG